MYEPLRLNLRFAAACTLAAAGLILLGLAVHAVPAHADPHFGLSELSTASHNADSVEVKPLAADWTWHHVFPLAHDSRGHDWRLDTDNVVLVTQAVALDPVFTLWSALSYTGGSSFPRDTTAWKDSVMAVVERYDGDGHDDFNGLVTPVKFWHVEQELSWWDDSAAHYSLYLGLTRRAILAADPTATVVCAGLDSGRLWGCAYRRGFVKMPPSSTQTYSDASLDRFEARIDTILGGGFYDVVDMHSYEQESLLRGKTDYVRSLMANPSRRCPFGASKRAARSSPATKATPTRSTRRWSCACSPKHSPSASRATP